MLLLSLPRSSATLCVCVYVLLFCVTFVCVEDHSNVLCQDTVDGVVRFYWCA